MNAQNHNMPWVRRMDAADLPAIALIEKNSHLSPWSQGQFLDSLRYPDVCIVLLDKLQPYAYAVLRLDTFEGHLLNITVAEPYRRQGWANFLLHQVFTIVAQKNIERILLEVRASNHAAIRCYQRYGFVKIAEQKNYYPQTTGRETAIIMAYAMEHIQASEST